MPDKPVNEVNLSTVLALLAEIDQRMREGFSALTQEQKKTFREEQQALSKRVEDGFAAVAREQQALREDQQTLGKRMKDGFAAVAQELQVFREDQQALSQHMEDGFAAAARERQTLSQRVEDGFASEALERQALANKLNDLTQWLYKEIPENAHILSKMIERVQNESAEFKREKSAHDKDVLQRLSRLETVRSLN